MSSSHADLSLFFLAMFSYPHHSLYFSSRAITYLITCISILGAEGLEVVPLVLSLQRVTIYHHRSLGTRCAQKLTAMLPCYLPQPQWGHPYGGVRLNSCMSSWILWRSIFGTQQPSRAGGIRMVQQYYMQEEKAIIMEPGHGGMLICQDSDFSQLTPIS